MTLNFKTFNFTSSLLASFGALLFVLSLLSGTLRLWDLRGPLILPSGSYGFAAAILLFLFAWILNQKKLRGLEWSEAAVALTLILLIVSDWTTRSYSLLVGPWIRGEILVGVGVFLLLNQRLRRISIFALVLVSPIILFVSFLQEADGRLLFSDDHSSVLYRLYLLKENFPNIPFYNPQWNGGWDSRDFFATGILNLFLLFSPLFYLFDIADIYTLIVATVCYVVLPLSLFVAARISSYSNLAAGLAALLGVTLSLNLHRWVFQYGSMGFVTSLALMPISFALSARLLDRGELTLKESLGFVVSSTFVLCWTPTAVIFIPAAIWGIIKLKTLLKSSRFIWSALALLVVNLPVILIFISVSRVGNFISLSSAPKNQTEITASAAEAIDAEKKTDIDRRIVKGMGKNPSFKEALKHLREEAIRLNPLVLVLILPALFLSRKTGYGKLFLPTFTFVFLVALVVSVLKPQLEFERLLLIVLLLAAVPIGGLVEKLLRADISGEDRSSQFTSIIPAALVFGVIVGALFSMSFHLRNRGPQQYYFASPTVASISQAINSYGGEGRVLFPGFVLHELSGGHLAPLAVFADKPLVASSPIHNLWWYTDQVPAYYRQLGSKGIEQYFDLMNASAVITHERDWIRYMDRRKGKYRRVWQGGKFTMFERVGFVSNYLVQGNGTLISQDTNSIKLRIDDESAVLKFIWFPFLRSSKCEIASKELPGDLEFIELTNCPPGSEVEIDSVPAWKRVMG